MPRSRSCRIAASTRLTGNTSMPRTVSNRWASLSASFTLLTACEPDSLRSGATAHTCRPS
jgi:hypothetical protein